MVTHDAGRECADLLEELARTGRPVTALGHTSPERVNPKSR
jgi:hypothetical protein